MRQIKQGISVGLKGYDSVPAERPELNRSIMPEGGGVLLIGTGHYGRFSNTMAYLNQAGQRSDYPLGELFHTVSVGCVIKCRRVNELRSSLCESRFDDDIKTAYISASSTSRSPYGGE
jgi:hypothetical protein